MFLPTQLGHTLPDSVYHRAVISTMSRRLASCPMCRWKPLAPNGCAEGRFIFIKLLCRLEVSRLEVSSLQGTYQGPWQNVYFLLILDSTCHGRAGGRIANSCHGLRHSACRCISPLIIYVTRLLFRHHPSSSQTTNVIANVVAKYLDFVDLYDVGFEDRKSAEETR